ncbi:MULTISPECIES: 3D domain-containing protein [Bacillaceae]|uniref:LysM peptidoglycan-binding and 3D domain-containing protein n=1 Tax=Bacillaceae TaxID=186817 RepID=UPI001E627EA9|nr:MULTISPECIES: 3D domain-containing protein [Bacillaceae]MCE4047827.1 LysM peptidoglycan-binding domain-containing protein [Bacillus sp. Au-Bac7]MCM3033237.1 LysM peptidoglycan-binding domain-containing protein [Niallia sp. MER 6]MDL0434851.1 LysM peptidoglycan-binding domain-containing protein [Niallia sp. SS-2023]UPO89330.1 LysM peptidoglycan-binding domain-containing protein [Niallia sp. Man26]
MKKLLSFIACATIATSIGTEAKAAEVTVKKGDTLWSISQDYNVSTGDIKDWNDLDSDIIKVNDTLDLQVEKKYKVKSGDTLWSIARENDNSVEDLMEWNDLSSEKIYAGEKIIVDNGIDKKDSGKKEKTKESAAKTVNKDDSGNAETLTVSATAYTADCKGCSGVTATGIDLNENPNQKVIAVDPKVIPLGSTVYVEGYGKAIAGDTGGAIKGNKIDLFMSSEKQALKWGRQQVEVKIID